jgi:hypothetical protein
MECWDNPIDSLTTFLEHLNSPGVIEHAQKNLSSGTLRHALCTLLSCRGTADEESPAGRMANCSSLSYRSHDTAVSTGESRQSDPMKTGNRR